MYNILVSHFSFLMVDWRAEETCLLLYTTSSTVLLDLEKSC